MAPYTTIIPKPLVPVGNRSILEVLISQLVRCGITDIVISLGYLGHLIRAVVGDGSSLGASVRYTTEDEPLGTAGALQLFAPQPGGSSVIVLNGDTLTDMEFSQFMDEHVGSGAAASVAVVERESHIDFGVVEMSGSGELERYVEKPSYSHLVSIGVNAFSTEALGEIERGERIDMPDFLRRVQSRGGLVRCVRLDCFWLDLGRVDDLRAAAELVDLEPDRFAIGQP